VEVQVPAVPEPSTRALVIVGLLFLRSLHGRMNKKDLK
jgi:hypothetical protein